MLVPQRFQRAVPVLAVFLLCLTGLIFTRFRHPELVDSIAHKITGNDKPAGKPPAEAGKNGGDKQEEVKTGPKPPSARPVLAPGECIPEIETLRRPELKLSDNIVYSRRCIKPIFSDTVNRDKITTLERPLITHKNTVNLTSCSHVEFTPCDHLTLQVPNPFPVETYKHLTFGVATTYDRLNESLPAFTQWLSGSGSELVAVIMPDKKKNEEDPEPPKRDSAPLIKLFARHNITLFTAEGNPNLTIDQNHFTMLRPVMDATGPHTRWVGILDDDTFFPSLQPVNKILDSYDHNKSLWLGALSEDFAAVKTWGYMAFGGAGVFMSLPLAREIEPVVDQCIKEAHIHTGDGILRDCIYAHSKTRLTIMPGLYQQDLHEDISGFFEAGLNPLSLHHWKSWYKAPVPKMSTITDLCGDCFLQRWQFGSDTLFSNGYSITQYRNGLDKIDLARMEGTMSEHGPKFDFSIGPMREALPKTEKRSYRLIDVVKTASGGFRQIYAYKADWENGEEMDEVVELFWEGKSDYDEDEDAYTR